MKRLLALLLALTLAPLHAAPQDAAPAAYTFTRADAKATWRQGLPEDCREVTPTCVYSPSRGAVYLLAELCGLEEGYEVEFFLLGALSDRAYEALAIAWDAPSTVVKAFAALGVPAGARADPQRGRAMAQGERVTMSLRRLGKDDAFRPLSDFVDDRCSTPAQNLFARGFPYIGTTGFDDAMPASVIAAYTEPYAIFGLPYGAPKSDVYGLFRSKVSDPAGTPVVVALQWQRLPDGQRRVLKRQVAVDAKAVADPDPLLTDLRALCEDPRDVFLDVRFAPSLTLAQARPFAALLAALEAEGGLTIDAPPPGQINPRAFLPDPAWLDRPARLFQPWELEIAHGQNGAPPTATLCQILEDWTVPGTDPALTRKCYPGVTPATVARVLRQVDANAGRVYVVFFYAQPDVTVGELAPFAAALNDPCPTQWIFLDAPAKPGERKTENSEQSAPAGRQTVRHPLADAPESPERRQGASVKP